MSHYVFSIPAVRRTGASIQATLIATLGLLTTASMALAEPAWTHTGDCRSCHVADAQASYLSIMEYDGWADPDASYALPAQKRLSAARGQTGKKLSVQVGGLEPGDTYNVAVVRLSDPGVLVGAQLEFTADCLWTDWRTGQDHFYTPAPRKYVWGSGPPTFEYSLDIPATATYDFYDLLFVVAGVKAGTGERFYSEEHAYLSIAPANWAPLATITSPAKNTTFTAPVDITLNAQAFDPDGSVTKVEFFAGATLLGEATAPPYSCMWLVVPAGVHQLTARATDNLGATTTSPVVNITVIPPPPIPGDFDHDGDVDQADFGHLQRCLTGTNGQLTVACADASLDGDTDADATDVQIFLRCLTGEGLPGNPQCAQ